jgi:hypothetical protein
MRKRRAQWNITSLPVPNICKIASALPLATVSCSAAVFKILVFEKRFCLSYNRVGTKQIGTLSLTVPSLRALSTRISLKQGLLSPSSSRNWTSALSLTSLFLLYHSISLTVYIQLVDFEQVWLYNFVFEVRNLKLWSTTTLVVCFRLSLSPAV